MRYYAEVEVEITKPTTDEARRRLEREASAIKGAVSQGILRSLFGVVPGRVRWVTVQSEGDRAFAREFGLTKVEVPEEE